MIFAAGIRAHSRWSSRVSALLLVSMLSYFPGVLERFILTRIAEADDPVALDASLYVNGEVYTSKTTADGTTYFGGQFTFVGPLTGPGVPVNATTGQRLGNYHKILSHGFSTTTATAYSPWIDKVISDGSGGWYVAGKMGVSGTSYVYDVIRISGAGSVDASFAVTVDGQVRTMVLSPDGNTLYIGGNFTTINGSSRMGIAAVDADSGALSSWNPNAVGFVLFGASNAYMTAMDVASDGTLYVGGNFQEIGGQTRHALAALDPATGLATAWNPRPYSCNGACSAFAQEAASTISDIEVDGTDVYVAGGWYSINGYNGVMLKRFAKLNNTDGTVATGWTTDSTNGINSIAVSSDAVYVGGWIGTIGGQARIGLAKMSKTGTVSSWNPNASGDDVEANEIALSADGSTLYFTGAFYYVNGTARTRAAAVSTSDGSLTAWNPSIDGDGYWDDSGRSLAVSSDGSSVYLGGSFQSVNGYTRDDIFSVDSSGNVTAFNPKVDVDWVVGDGSYTIVYAITTDPSNSIVYFGGDFGMVNGTNRYYLAAANATDGSLLGWNPDPDDIIMSLETNEDGSVIFAGGDGIGCLNNYGDCTFSGFVPIQASTGLRLQGWGDGGTNYWGDSILAIKRSGSKLYVAGDFYEIGQTDPVVRMGIAQLDISTGAVTSWNAGLDSSSWNTWVNDVEVDVTGVYVGGSFTDVGCDEFDNNCTPRRNFAKFHRTTGAVLPFDPNPDGIIYNIETNGPTIYAAGEFLNIGGAPRARLAALDYSLDTNNATSWDPGIDATSTSSYIEPMTLSKNGDTLYVGGYFMIAGSGIHPNLAAFTIDDNPNLTLTPQAQFSTSTGSGLEKVTPVQIAVDLNTELSATATVDYAVTGGTAASGTRYSLQPGTLSFAPNVTTAYVPLGVVSDTAIRPNQTVEITLSNPSGVQLGSNTVFTYTVVDGTATSSGVTVAKPGGAINLTEGGPSGSYTIALDTQPSANVDIRISSDAFSTTTQKTLTFTPSNWSTPQTVTVTAIDNPSYVGTHGSRITHTASSSDPLYHGISIARVSLTIHDDLSAPTYVKQDEQSWWINDNYSPAVNQALTAPDGTTYLAGRFSYLGKITYFGALLRKDTGYPDFPFPYIRYTPGGEDTYGDSGVYAVVPDGEGGMVRRRRVRHRRLRQLLVLRQRLQQHHQLVRAAESRARPQERHRRPELGPGPGRHRLRARTRPEDRNALRRRRIHFDRRQAEKLRRRPQSRRHGEGQLEPRRERGGDRYQDGRGGRLRRRPVHDHRQ